MQVLYRIKENWFTRRPRAYKANPTLLMASLLVGASFLFFTNVLRAQEWMTSSPGKVFLNHQYWRAWTTLLAHADGSHLLSNLLLFIPLVYLLTAYFNLWLFPVLGFLFGGITNLIVLKTLPLDATLLGVSGVVYWMGAAWFTLFFLIDRRQHPKARFANILFLCLMLFIPETYEPHISYLSHFLGFAFGIVCGFGYYLFYRQQFLRAEIREPIIEEEEESLWTSV